VQEVRRFDGRGCSLCSRFQGWELIKKAGRCAGLFAETIPSHHFALAGGLITGILAPLSGGGTFKPESFVGGGQMTPFEAERLSPSGAPDGDPSLFFCAGVQDCEFVEG
jgi:hypothetical protein